MLFSLYISIPVISLIIKNKKILFYFACLCFYTQALIPLLTKFLHIQFLSYYNIPIAGSYLGYILLGYLISTTEIKKKYRYIIYCLGILSLFVMFFGTFLLSNNIGKLDDFFLRYESITLYFLSIAVFTFAKYMNWTFLEHGLANKVIRVLSSASFGVYLIQMFVIHYYKRILNINENSFMFMTFGTLIIYLICAVLVLSIKKIPFLRRIFP